MTLVNPDTGEILDADGAERRASYICTDLDSAANSFEHAMGLMREAMAQRDDITLGYRSPGDYLSDRFGGRLARLGVDLRREVFRELTEAGLSTRAIAPVLSTSHMTVARDLAGVTGVTPQTPASSEAGAGPESFGPPPQVAPTEGDATAAAVKAEPDDVIATTPEGGTPAPTRPPVVGIDGKTYPRPAPMDYAPRAAAAVREFPELAFYVARGEAEHAWRLAERLRAYPIAERVERLNTLRRSITTYFRAKTVDGLPRFPEVNAQGEHVQLELLSVAEFGFVHASYVKRSDQNLAQAAKIRQRCIAVHGVEPAAVVAA